MIEVGKRYYTVGGWQAEVIHYNADSKMWSIIHHMKGTKHLFYAEHAENYKIINSASYDPTLFDIISITSGNNLLVGMKVMMEGKVQQITNIKIDKESILINVDKDKTIETYTYNANQLFGVIL